MRNLPGLPKMTPAVLAVLWASGAAAGPSDPTARLLIADWKDGDRAMAAVAEVIASAFASGMIWAGSIDGRPLYCPPAAPLTGRQVMSALESFVADNPDAADRPYGFALSAGLRRAFPCTPG